MRQNSAVTRVRSLARAAENKETTMKLSDMLGASFTDAAYLAHQRTLHAARCEALRARILLKKDDTAYIEKKKAGAVHAMNNMFVLPGSGGVRMHVGDPPAWNECRTADEEYLWHLNRMGYFNELTELYLLTGERAYADKVVTDILHWIDICPLPPLPTEEELAAMAGGADMPTALRRSFGGLTPWRSLEVGIRTFSTWNTTYDRLLHTEIMTPELHTKLFVSLYEHAKVLRVMSPLFWPKANHNHYIHEMLGLLEIACLFPDLTEAEAWTSFAIAELGRCADNQFTPEGGQVEGCPGYHSGCLGMFFSLVEVSRAFGLTLPERLTEVLKRAAEYVLYTVTPDGKWASIGDTPITEGGRSTVTSYYRCFGALDDMRKLLAIHPQYDPLAIPEDVQAEARAYAATAAGGDNFQRALGQYMARTDWTPQGSYFMFICNTPVNNGHTHQDPMSFVLTLQGDNVVIDPSYFAYRNCPERKLFKSPEYHSCLTFDGKPPFEFISVWGYSPQKEGHMRKAYRMDGVYAADASHNNYDPDYHKRLCALVGDDIFLVADDVLNVTGTDVRLYFHMDDPTVRIEGQTAVSERIRVLLPEGVEAEVAPSDKSPYTDLKKPTSRLILKDTAHKNRQYLTVFTKRSDVTDAHIERTAEGVKISFKVGGKEQTYLWVFSCSLTKIDN